MKKILNRRQFIRSSFAGVAALGTGFINPDFNSLSSYRIDRVRLGDTGLSVPLVALGTGTRGSRRESNQTRIGQKEFVKIARHAFDHGINFYDMAELYGSHTYVKEFLKGMPRENAILLSKIWTVDSNWYTTEPVEDTLDRFRIEAGTDYFDIILLHCMLNGNWQAEKRSFIDSLSRAKQKGIVKAVGVSCHNWDAMKVAVEDPWVDVILARINPFGSNMDGDPDAVMGLLETARKNGKGVIGMKIFGQGKHVSDEEREISLRYALKSPNIHSMTLGFENTDQIDQVVRSISRIV